MADYGNGRKAEIAELVANGDTIERYTDGSESVRAITSVEIAARLGTSPANVRQIWARIRADLGWQAC